MRNVDGTSAILLTVDVVILTLRDSSLHVLLVQRRAPPFAGQWAIPGGLVQSNESLEEGARRTLYERTGIQNVPLEQLHTFDDLDRDPRGRVVTVAYCAVVPAPLAAHAGRNAADVCWQPVRMLPEMAFDHAKIVQFAVQRLRQKLAHSAIGFQLLPERFTLSQLQRAYEAVLGESLDKRNFRRRILQAGVIEPTGEVLFGDGRPARLYRCIPSAVAEVKPRRVFP
ncbi:MAG: NUDIX hydrolase [Thermoflexales bacterium]|nr:NUDIX hydrolase [Thermoflexales bacterium]